MRRTARWMGGAAVLMILFSGWALGQEPEEQLTVTSQHQKVDYVNRIFVYSGEVLLEWKDVVIEGDEVSVYITEENTLIKLVAKGKVRITEKETKTKTSGEMATYTAEDDKIVLEGNAQYEDDFGNTILADRIVLWREERRMEATGSPVRATYFLEEVQVDSSSGKSD
jgi:lipopolysaccharide transport protein LptA